MRTVLLGLDAFDPQVTERLLDQGRLPNLAKHLHSQGYARLSISNPAQSEVSWTSIATGANPGVHGMFDFVHRDPENYRPYVSMLPTKSGLGGVQFAPAYATTTVFDHTARQGYPSTSLWWPVTFPARLGSPVNTIPGLGTPDIHGRLGVGSLFVSDAALLDETLKTRVALLRGLGRGRYAGSLKGPARKKRNQVEETALGFELELIGDETARLFIGGQSVDLARGQWGPILHLKFAVGRFVKLHALTRVLLADCQPVVRLYLLPLQLHPLHSPWPYGTPYGFLKQTWQACGPFLTLGWPQDTVGLEEGCLTDDQFNTLCDSIFRSRERVLLHQLRNFREGLLGSVFDSLDRIQHMFWRRRPDIVDDWYIKLDTLVGKVWQSINNQHAEPAQLLVLSDHGFTDFNYKVNLNRWLIAHGFLTPRKPAASGGLGDVDWSRTQAYAIGLNSIYLNLAGREGQGVVTAEQAADIMQRLQAELLAWVGPNGQRAITRVAARSEAFEGPLAGYGPDLLVGFAPGYRASSKTGLGEWGETPLEANRDHWEADHCVDPDWVPGVLFSSRGLRDLPRPSYRDIPMLVVGEKQISGSSASPPVYSKDEAEAVEERLRSLGYL